jgi:hypothetical protein
MVFRDDPAQVHVVPIEQVWPGLKPRRLGHGRRRPCHRWVSSALIQQGLAALRGGDVAAARRVFESALAEGESGQVLEGLGEALYLGREYVAAVAHICGRWRRWPEGGSG